MKTYTDLEQSTVLSKILQLESADMSYRYSEKYGIPDYQPTLCPYKLASWIGVPCWSLAALLDVLPHIQEFYPIVEKINDKYVCRYKGNGIWTNGTNAVDACVEMILKLHEEKLL